MQDVCGVCVSKCKVGNMIEQIGVVLMLHICVWEVLDSHFG
jgi:hypothetical protein